MEGFLKEQLQAITNNENEINSKIKSKLPNNNNKINFQWYYILNKDWYNAYKNSIKFRKNDNLFTKVENLFPSVKQKCIDYIYKTYNFPGNFAIVNQNLMNKISRHFGENNTIQLKNLGYQVLIFGQCIIIKSNLIPSIIFVSVLKENSNNNNDNDTSYENDIRYIFEFNSLPLMEHEIKNMQQDNFKSYLKFRNIGENNNVDYREIKNRKGEINGIIIYNRIEKDSEPILMLENNNILNPINVKNPVNQITKMNPYLKSILLGLNQFDIFTNGLKQILKLNSNYEMAKLFSAFFGNISAPDAIGNQIESKFNSSIKSGKYETILLNLILKLDNELIQNKNNFNKNEMYKYQYDELQSLQYFKMVHNNPSLIENLFYITYQNKIQCEKCNSTRYEYEYKQFLLVELNGKENDYSIKDKLYEIKTEKDTCIKCKNNNCKKEIKIIELPKILIVVIQRKSNERFSIKNNFKILNKERNGLIFSLHCIIENKTNNIYFSRTQFWYKIDENNNEKLDNYNNIHDIDPSVLFFKSLIDGEKYQININQINICMNNNMNQNMNQMNNFSNNNIINNNLNINNNNSNFQGNMNNQINMNNQSNQINSNNQQTNFDNQMNMNMNMNNQPQNFNIINQNNNMNNQANINNIGNQNINNNSFNMNNMTKQNNMNNIMNINNQMNPNSINNQNNLNNMINFNNMNVFNSLNNNQNNNNSSINNNNQNNMNVFNSLNNNQNNNNSPINNNNQNNMNVFNSFNNNNNNQNKMNVFNSLNNNNNNQNNMSGFKNLNNNNRQNNYNNMNNQNNNNMRNFNSMNCASNIKSPMNTNNNNQMNMNNQMNTNNQMNMNNQMNK